MKIFIGENLSCNLNYQHYMIYNALAEKFDITEIASEADKIVFPTSCCCTEDSILNTVQYYQSIIALKKKNAEVYLTGCMSREFTKQNLIGLSKWLKENIDYIIPQNNPNLLLKLIDAKAFETVDVNAFGYTDLTDDNDVAVIFLSNGCLNNCTFCKTTFQNYPLKSMALNEVKDAIDYWDEHGVSTLLFMGTNICQYGFDIKKEYLLPEVIFYAEQKKNIKDLRFVGFAFKDAIQNNFQDVLKMSLKTTLISGSLESGSDRILKLCNKGFTSKEIIEFVTYINQIKQKHLQFTIISGFPTETIEDVKRTLEVLKKLNPYKVDISRYINSSFIESNQYEQLSQEAIQEHTRIYSKVLKQRKVNFEIF